MAVTEKLSFWSQAGGEEKIRPIIEALVARMRADVMIGFFFRRTRLERLIELELQHASSHLGGPLVYSGRPIKEAHGRLGIASGHFLRRRQILSELLVEFTVPRQVAEAWLIAQDTLKGDVVVTTPSCPDDPSLGAAD